MALAPNSQNCLALSPQIWFQTILSAADSIILQNWDSTKVKTPEHWHPEITWLGSVKQVRRAFPVCASMFTTAERMQLTDANVNAAASTEVRITQATQQTHNLLHKLSLLKSVKIFPVFQIFGFVLEWGKSDGNMFQAFYDISNLIPRDILQDSISTVCLTIFAHRTKSVYLDRPLQVWVLKSPVDLSGDGHSVPDPVGETDVVDQRVHITGDKHQ